MSQSRYPVKPPKQGESIPDHCVPESVKIFGRLTASAIGSYRSQPPIPSRHSKPRIHPTTITFSSQSALGDQLTKSTLSPAPKRPIIPRESQCSTATSRAIADEPNDYYQNTKKITSSSEALSLTEAISLYKHSFPIRIRVKEGYCGKEERSVISAGDVYNFHFIKRDEVLFVEDEEGKTFSIPLNSSIKFGLLQRPFRNMRNLREFKYKMVGDLATGCEPPLLVKATQNFNSGEAISSVEAEEVLIVKKIHRTRHYKLYVEAFSLCTYKQKILYEDCAGCFLTSPTCVELYVTDIVDHLKDSLPIKATLSLDSDICGSRLSRVPPEIVTLKHIAIESFVIATTCWNENDAIPDMATDRDDHDLIPVAIPTDLKISLTVLGDQSESESLYEDTRQLYEHFDPSKVHTVSSSSDDSDIYTALVQNQSLTVRSGHEYQGLQIIKPSRIYGEDCYSNTKTVNSKN